MKITLLQTDIAWDDVETNLTQAEKLIGRHESSLYVLPETWSTGFNVAPTEETAARAARSAAWMRETAQRKNAAVCGSVISRENGLFFNRFLFAFPDGSCAAYDKRHLFTYGNEQLRYAPGHRRVVVEYLGIRILLQICYDLRFPVFSRNRADYDLAIYIANWPVSRQAAWETLARARAIENQCYVAAVNRIGKDPACAYAGGSALFDAYGREKARARQNLQPEAIDGEMCLEELQAFRKKFPVLSDADAFRLL